MAEEIKKDKEEKEETPVQAATEISSEEEVDESPIILEWDALEYLHHERGVIWYLIGAIIAILVVVYAVIAQEWTMAIVMVLLAGVIYLYSHETPRVHHIMITELGIHVGHRNYLFGKIKSFWMIYEPDIQTLNLRVSGKIGEEIVIQLADQDPVDIRDILLRYLNEEEGKEENFVDKVGRWLKI